jgi:phosphatidylserine/phosphatidylglycerophosphate/cardiolipin synthase-like enzyme
MLGLLVTASAEIEIYLSPKGGFSATNNERTIVFKNGEKVPANLNHALLDLIERSEEGSTIKIAMYSFSYKPIQEALLTAARERKIHVKLLLDTTAEWTRKMHLEYATRIAQALAEAAQKGQPFAFEVKEVNSKTMLARGRWREAQDKTIIHGTMHEKFGIFYAKGSLIPLHSFCGSANISYGAGESAAENRLFFLYEPGISRQLAEEFARLWNEYGTPLTDNCQSERFIPAMPQLGEVQFISNSKPLDEEKNQRIDDAVLRLMDQVEPESGSLDVCMFSFTNKKFALKLLGLAQRYPKIKVRVLLDQTQIEDNEDNQRVQGPFLEETVAARKLANIEVRYKWRSNAFAWDAEKDKCRLITFRNLLLHHKCVIVNGKRMSIGSYNWSSSAETRNLENMLVFYGEMPAQQKILNAFLAEYETVWKALKKKEAIAVKLLNPQVVFGPQGRELRKAILAAFGDPHCKKIMHLIDKQQGGRYRETLIKETGLAEIELLEKLHKLEEATLIFPRTTSEGKILYSLAD